MIAIHTLLEPVASQFMLRTLTMTHILFSFQKTMRVITNNDNDWISIPVIALITEIVNIMYDQHCSNSKQDFRRRTQYNISNKQVNNKNIVPMAMININFLKESDPTKTLIL